MSRSKYDTAFRDAVVAETRGSATEAQVELLEGDVDRWVRTLTILARESRLRLEEVGANYISDLAEANDAPDYDGPPPSVIEHEYRALRARVKRFNSAMEARLEELNTTPARTQRLIDYFVTTFDLEGVADELPDDLKSVLSAALERNCVAPAIAAELDAESA